MIFIIVLVALVYLRAWMRIRSDATRAIASWRAAGFVLGLVLVWMAVASPLLRDHGHLLTVHMIRHLLLMSLAPPLIWLGEPLRVIADRPRETLILRAIAGWPGIRRLGQRLGDPVLCWIVATIVLIAWHVPQLRALSMQSGAWQAIEDASFFLAGLLFWWPVIQPWPAATSEWRWPIVLYLFLATLPCDFLSGFLVFSERIVYPMPHALPPGSLSVLDDQQLAGALMWTVVTLVYLVAGVIVAVHALARVGPANTRERHAVIS